MARVGVVMQTEGARAEVAAGLRGPCSSCSESGACHAQLAPSSSPSVTVTVENDVGAKAGDTVELDLLGHAELKLAFYVWAVPLVGLVLGAIGGATLFAALGLGEDGGTLTGAILGFVGAMLLLRGLDARAARDPRLMPHIVRIVDDTYCPSAMEKS
jgi:sigma-E factor negative regulatory protein RseC